MFIDFFYHMRERGLSVSPTEWLAMMRALEMGLGHDSLAGFYHLCRSLCVKNEAHFDLYDQCFAEHFRDAEPSATLRDEILKWLEQPASPRQLSPEELAALEKLDFEELRRQFEERMRNQKERHDRGNRHIGTGGASPFGHSGTHPEGIRVGGESQKRSAVQVASQRRFRNLRHDRILDVRQIGVALRQLRRLARSGRPDELDLEDTVDATARNAGDLELVFRPERKNVVKLVLLMDVGGSMTPYARLCERLFSAAHAASHFKAFKYYYFHNCPYETLYTDMLQREGRPTREVLADFDPSWVCIVVGDAAMHPYELTMAGGSVDYFHHNPESGLTWLHRIHEALPRTVWLNPEPVRYWGMPSVRLIKAIFAMYPMTLAGLEDAITALRGSQPPQPERS